jgi:hypothetical protein
MRLPAANQTLDDDGKGREDGALCRRSRRLAHLCAAFAVALPVGVVVSCAAGQVPDLPGLSKTIDLAALVWWQVGIVLAGMLAPVLPVSLALLVARRCFLAVGRGAIFTLETVAALRRIAGLVTLGGIAGLIAPTVVVLGATVLAAPGQRQLAISISSGPLLTLVLGAVVYLIADIMQRAARMAEDHAQIV